MFPSHSSTSSPPPPVEGLLIKFDPETVIEEVRGTLELSRIAAETLYGTAVFALDANYRLDPDDRTVWIETSSGVGRTLALLFMGFVREDFDSATIMVTRVTGGAK